MVLKPPLLRLMLVLAPMASCGVFAAVPSEGWHPLAALAALAALASLLPLQLAALLWALSRMPTAAAESVDRQVARQRLSHLLAVAAEAVAQLETAGIEPLRVQPNRQGIAANERPPVVGVAMHERQGHRWCAARGGEQLGRRDAEALQALLVGLVAPAQQLLEMHHPGGVGLAEAHRAAQEQPAVGVGGGRHGGVIGATARGLWPSHPPASMRPI